MDRLSTDTSGLDLSVYLARLRRRWWLIVILMLAGLGAAFVFTQSQTPAYRSTASVLVTPAGVPDRAGGVPEVNLDTEVQIVKSYAVAEAARTLLNTATPAQELLQGVDVFVPPNTQVMEVSFVASSADGAQQAAHAFAQAYLENRTAQARGAVTSQIEALEAELQGLQESLQTVSGQIVALPPDSPDRAFAEAQRSVLINQVSTVQTRLSPLRAAPTSGGSIINDSDLPNRPTSPIAPLNYASGLLGGLVFGIVAALMLDRRDRRIRSARDVEDRLGLPVVADVPRPRASGPLAVAPTATPAGQAYAELRNAVAATLPPGQRVLVLTGASPGRGGGLVSANLARGLAHAGHSVILLCADGNSPSSLLLGIPSAPGLGEVLRKEAELADVLRGGNVEGLRVCPPGDRLDEHSERLQSALMTRIVKGFREAADYVVIDAPSTATGAQAQSLARLADAALIVVVTRRTTQDDVEHASRQLERIGARVQGVVVVPDAYTRLGAPLSPSNEVSDPARPAALSEA